MAPAPNIKGRGAVPICDLVRNALRMRPDQIIVGTMPILLAGILTVIKPGMMLPFYQSRTGIISIAAVIIMLICGGLLIRKIIRIDV